VPLREIARAPLCRPPFRGVSKIISTTSTATEAIAPRIGERHHVLFKADAVRNRAKTAGITTDIPEHDWPYRDDRPFSSIVTKFSFFMSSWPYGEIRREWRGPEGAAV
jgi:hypothetical protein